jgi:hypothetical protein
MVNPPRQIGVNMFIVSILVSTIVNICINCVRAVNLLGHSEAHCLVCCIVGNYVCRP